MNIIRSILKTFAAGAVAVGILSILCSFYYLQPAHIDNSEGNTDYVWTASSRWLKMTEGISWGKFDTAGYNNPEVVENPDIIVLGSSHTEATNVVQGKDFSALLREKLDGKYSLYNMGISGHNFLKVCQYLPQNLARYETTPKLVIIETSTLTFTAAEIDAMLEGTIAKSPSYNTGIIAISQKSPFFSLLYNQVQGGLIDLFLPDKEKLLSLIDGHSIVPPLSAPLAATPEMSEKEKLQDAYSRMFEYLGRLQQQYNTQILIVHHPLCQITQDGNVLFIDEDIKPVFRHHCEEQNIYFADMLDSFYDMYNTQHKLPHGFITGRIGFGHLNADGHAAFADVLYDAVMQLSEEGRLCR